MWTSAFAVDPALNHNLHKCNDRCMLANGKCQKEFPKAYVFSCGLVFQATTEYNIEDVVVIKTGI